MGIGLALGIPIALASTRMIESQLYGVDARDIPEASCATLLLCATAMVAPFVPAWRTARLNPVDAPRHQ